MSLRYNSKIGRYEILLYKDGRSGPRFRKRLPAGTSREEAELIHEEALISYKGVRPPPEFGLIVDRLTQKYLSWYELHRRPSTAHDARATFEGPISRILGEKVSEAIAPQDITDYQKQRKGEGVSNRTINKELDYFSGCLRWASKSENALISPRQWKIDKLPYKRPIPHIPTIQDVAEIMNRADPFNWAFFMSLYTMGLRVNEARNIRRIDIDAKQETVTVERKGGNFKRVPCPPVLIEAYQKLLSQYENPKPADLVFRIARTDRPVQNIRQALDRIAKKAGVERHIHPHLLRHAFATHLLEAGSDIRHIQELMGHADIHQTQWYTQVVGNRLHDASEKIMTGLSRWLQNPR